MDKEVEEVSFLPGETILNKKAIYEPSTGQRFRQVICTRGWAIASLMITGTVLVGIALIAAFARPTAPVCDVSTGSDAGAAAGSGVDKSASAGTSGKDGQPTAAAKQTYVATNGEKFPWKDLRLPKSLEPVSYDIFLHPNISGAKFTGHVDMTLKVVEETDFVIFHLKELNISQVTVTLEGANDGTRQQSRPVQTLTITKQLEYKTNQQYYVHLSEKVSAGSVIHVVVNFAGLLSSEAMSGFYLSSYTVNGEQRQMASTQFESTDARKAFPCLDEPAMKATFKLSIVRETKHITLFNMPLVKTDKYGGNGELLLDVYEASPIMSTYLVAFAVCDFKSISSKTKAGTDVRVFAPEDKIFTAHYALDVAVSVLENYTEFFGLPYDLPKADLMAIPNFEAGAMENWGLITYRDTAILYDPVVSSQESKKWVTIVIAHELAHQWFGNLVTMDWWDDLWLNEGFATFVQFIGLDVVDKDFRAVNSLSQEYTRALYSDSLANSHPIKVPVADPAEIASVFDNISYQKGAAMIKMLESVLGRDKFRLGLNNYLKAHTYGNAVTQDLWRSWQQVSDVQDLSVPEMMDTWTLQMGYPVVTVSWDGQTLHLSQSRFLLSGAGKQKESKYKSPYGYKWYIPFTYTTSAQPAGSKLVFLKDEILKVPLAGDNSRWLKANKDLHGFYRVNYDAKGWASLIEQLKRDHTVFSVNDRVGLMDDAFSLARAGLLNYSVALDAVRYMGQESDFFVWDAVQPYLTFFADRLVLEEEYDLIRDFILSIIKPQIDVLGWEPTGDVNTRQLRASLIETALAMEDKDSVKQARQLFNSWKLNASVQLNSDLRSAVYKTGVKFGDEQDWELVYQRYKTSKVASDQSDLLMALAASRDVRLLQILLDYALDVSKIPSQNTAQVLSHVALNRNGLLQAWRFLRLRWSLILDRFGVTSSIVRNMVKIVKYFNTQFDLDEVEEFFHDKNLGSAERPLQQSLELVRNHVAWGKQHMPEVKGWLRKNSMHQ